MSEQGQFTPGPWEVVTDYDVNDCPTGYARVFAGEKAIVDDYVNIEDARLIAAAPALLEVLKDMRDACAAAMRVISRAGLQAEFLAEFSALGIENGFGVHADAAILKAEGR